ncbi:MAG: serine/tyrosine/threonine adenylyltransferase [Solirubrobacteraceae bacterium]|nr:serine/tyrosine/threonine adenylyltransferase [Solirubrobacteraceae bacterium]
MLGRFRRRDRDRAADPHIDQSARQHVDPHDADCADDSAAGLACIRARRGNAVAIPRRRAKAPQGSDATRGSAAGRAAAPAGNRAAAATPATPAGGIGSAADAADGDRQAASLGWPATGLVSLKSMSIAARPLFAFDNSYVRELEGLYVPWQATSVPAPLLLALNEGLATELGVDGDALRAPDGLAVLVGNATRDGAPAVAQAYAGHQFGRYLPRLGDGRALLLGEVLDVHGRRRDLHLKGSGRTPFARGGDGMAAVGPMLREYVIGEAMHALGIPTTRALAVVATGDQVVRDTLLPGAVLVRVAASHVRVGTFQYAATHDDPTLVRRLADHAIARHHPHAVDAENPYLAFFEAVVDAQASLIARWMLVGFIHGVMNTDNMAVSGETIDYGPCAFMDAFDPATVFSSIDHGGRYAYANQPPIAQWNLARLAETLLPLLDVETDTAIAAADGVLQSFPDRYRAYWSDGMRAKLGLADGRPEDGALIDDLLALLHAQGVDFTSCFRALSSSARGDTEPARSLFDEPSAFDAWSERWRARLSSEASDPHAIADAMDRVNPVYIGRNHHVEEALAAATAGDLGPFRRLLDVLAQPFHERPGLEPYTGPAPPSFGAYRTFCGT